MPPMTITLNLGRNKIRIHVFFLNKVGRQEGIDIDKILEIATSHRWGAITHKNAS